MNRAHVFIHGDVTGVGFRSWTVRKANSLGLTGWVTNADYKTVEAVFEGPKEKIEKVIRLCHKGPETSWVEKVDVEWEEARREHDDFSIKY